MLLGNVEYTREHARIRISDRVGGAMDMSFGNKIFATRETVKCMGPSEKASFAMGPASIRWDPLFRLNTCEEKYL